MAEVYSASDYEIAINAAITAHDFEAAVALLRRLAVVDPHRAQAVLDVVELAMVIRRG